MAGGGDRLPRSAYRTLGSTPSPSPFLWSHCSLSHSRAWGRLHVQGVVGECHGGVFRSPEGGLGFGVGSATAYTPAHSTKMAICVIFGVRPSQDLNRHPPPLGGCACLGPAPHGVRQPLCCRQKKTYIKIVNETAALYFSHIICANVNSP